MALSKAHAHSSATKAQGSLFKGIRASAPRRGCTHVCNASRDVDQAILVSRRNLLSVATIVPALSIPELSRADEGAIAVSATTSSSSSSVYTDPQERFSIAVPAGWSQAEGQLEGNTSFSGASGARRTLAWFPEGGNANEVNVSITITNVSVEFTKLGSFGNVFAFGSNLVNQMDRSYLLRSRRNTEPVQIAKLLDADEKRGMYFVEYTVQKMPDPMRYFKSVVALSNNGKYNRLYTVTAQCLNDQLPEYGAALDKVIASFEPPLSMAARRA